MRIEGGIEMNTANRDDVSKVQLEEIKKAAEGFKAEIATLQERVATLEAMIDNANAFVLDRPEALLGAMQNEKRTVRRV